MIFINCNPVRLTDRQEPEPDQLSDRIGQIGTNLAGTETGPHLSGPA